MQSPPAFTRMSQAAQIPVDSHASEIPVARIDAQDEPFVLPLREYLETNGVRVSGNQTGGGEIAYHIAVGDQEFVYENFRSEEQSVRRLGIVIGKREGFIARSNTKYIFADPTPLTQATVFEIFEFFFTGETQTLDIRSSKEEPHIEKKLVSRLAALEIPEAPHVLSQDDRNRISHLMSDAFGEDAKPEGKKIREVKRKRRKLAHRWFAVFVVGLGIMLAPFVWYAASLGIGGAALFSAARSLEKGNLGSAAWQTAVSKNWIEQGRASLSVLTVPLALLGQRDAVRSQERLMSFLADTETALEEVQSTGDLATRVASGLLNQVDVTGTGVTPASDIAELRTSLYSVENTLGLAQAELATIVENHTFPFSLTPLKERGAGFVKELAQVREAAENSDQLLALFSQMAGFKEPRTYLILLQNSMELRPTGGFIGSVAIATFAEGRLTDLNIQDVYTFDGQLKGHVDPPVPVREQLGIEHWYLRDSNWDPDFFAAGTRAAWFYQKETGNAVDGVFAVNVPFVVELLKATGPIQLADYNDRISADNFYGKSLYYTQNDFFPGSTQKKDFLGTLTRALITKITTGKDVNTAALFRALTTAFSRHNILMTFGDTGLQSLVEHYGWAGRVPSIAGCAGVDRATCFFDPLIMIEANLGVNKVNSFITRAVTRDVVVGADGKVNETVSVAFKNTSGSDRANAGMGYHVYIRFRLPANSSVGAITFDSAPVLAKEAKQKIAPYMEITDGGNALGISLDVPAGTEKQLVATWEYARPLVFGPGGAILELFDQKQPGVEDTPVHTIVRYPLRMTAGIEAQTLSNTDDFIAKEGQVEYNTVLSRDSTRRIHLTQ